MKNFKRVDWLTEVSVQKLANSTTLKPPAQSSLTLQGGSSILEGNVFYPGGPICDDDWDDRDAKVVCHEIGADTEGARKTNQSRFGTVSARFSMDDVKCTGQEHKLIDCPYNTNEDCEANEGAGVICQPLKVKSDGVKSIQ